MLVEIITPEAVLFRGESHAISLPGKKGSFQILENHAPIISTLTKGTITVQVKKGYSPEEVNESVELNGTDYDMNIESGTIELLDEKLIILAE